MTLTQIEKQIADKISDRIIDNCLENRPDNPSAYIKDASIGILYMADALHNLPKDHTLKPHLSKISEMANNIDHSKMLSKEDTAEWVVLRGIK
jgi:S-adenosylmethionine synthetase